MEIIIEPLVPEVFPEENKIKVKFEDSIKYHGNSFEEILQKQQGSWEPCCWENYRRSLEKRLRVLTGQYYLCPTPESYFRHLENLGLVRIYVQ